MSAPPGPPRRPRQRNLPPRYRGGWAQFELAWGFPLIGTSYQYFPVHIFLVVLDVRNMAAQLSVHLLHHRHGFLSLSTRRQLARNHTRFRHLVCGMDVAVGGEGMVGDRGRRSPT